MIRDDDDETTTTGTYPIEEDRRPGDTAPPPLAATGRLVCLVGPRAGQAFPLGAKSQVIGRAPDADISIDANDVSRRHARLDWRHGELEITDLGSRNGTHVNGVPVRTKVLQIGDRVQIGLSSIFVYARHDELEQRAQRMQKLEGLAQLAGGMAHDFRNTLGLIRGTAQLLEEMIRERAGGDAELLQLAHDIDHAVEAGLEVTQRLLTFSRREVAGEAAQVKLRGLVDEVVALVRRTFLGEHAIRIDVAIDDRLEVRGRKGELHHALLNLCLNARDAMPQGGRLAISARAVRVRRAEAPRLQLPRAGDYVELAVADTGAGMDEATLARVFEPFFTTKKPGEGTGLGLSTVYGIVRQHGGAIQVESRPGEGTCFNLLLPDTTPGRGLSRDPATGR
jgi:signal transduction histidine kinase